MTMLRRTDLHYSPTILCYPQMKHHIKRTPVTAWHRVHRSADYDKSDWVPSLSCLRTCSLPPLQRNDDTEAFSSINFDSIKSLELNNATLLGPVGESVARLTNLQRLRLVDVDTDRKMIESLQQLSKLKILKLKRIAIHQYDGDLTSCLPSHLSHLEIDCCATSLGDLSRFDRLKTLVIGGCRVEAEDIDNLNKCPARIHIKIYGRQSLKELEHLSRLKNLSRLEIEDVGTCEIPAWMGKMPLSALVLKKGQVNFRSNDMTCLPRRLTSLCIPFGNVSDHALSGFCEYARRLKQLEIFMPIFVSNLNLSTLKNLVSLKLSGGELDGEVLRGISALDNLENLSVGGCWYLDGSHLSSLESINSLKSLSITCCQISRCGCEQLARIKQLRKLSFYYCPTLHPSLILEMPNLRSLRVGSCCTVEYAINDLLKKSFVKKLDFLGFRFIQSSKDVISALNHFMLHFPRVTVNPNIEIA